MKKISKLLVVTLLLCMTLITLGGCNTKYRVKLNVDGRIYDILYVDNFANLPTITEPVKGGYHFAGWYYDAEFTRSADLDELASSKTKLKEDINLYGKWQVATDVAEFYADGNVLLLQNITSSKIKNIDYSDTRIKVIGWYSDELLTVPFDFTRDYSGRVKVYGKPLVYVDSLLAYLDTHVEADAEMVLRDDSLTKIVVTKDGTLKLEAKDQLLQYDIASGALTYIAKINKGYKIQATAEYLYRGGEEMTFKNIIFEGDAYDKDNILISAELSLLSAWYQLDVLISNYTRAI